MQSATVTELKVHSRDHCLVFTPEQMRTLEAQAVSFTLESGTNVVKIQRNASTSEPLSERSGEPSVMLWIYGGEVTNTQTNVTVKSTWVSLQGYDDALTLDVTSPATMAAFFFDPAADPSQSETTLFDNITLSVECC